MGKLTHYIIVKSDKVVYEFMNDTNGKKQNMHSFIKKWGNNIKIYTINKLYSINVKRDILNQKLII